MMEGIFLSCAFNIFLETLKTFPSNNFLKTWTNFLPIRVTFQHHFINPMEIHVVVSLSVSSENLIKSTLCVPFTYIFYLPFKKRNL